MTDTEAMQTREFPAALEHLLAVAREFLDKKISIGKLRQAVREAEDAAPACDYCGRKPAFSVIWHIGDGLARAVMHLCPDCDNKEIKTLEED